MLDDAMTQHSPQSLVSHMNSFLQHCIAPCLTQPNILSTYLLIKSTHHGILLNVSMLYDSAKHQEINASALIASWREARVIVAGMQRAPDENAPKLMNLYIWSELIDLQQKKGESVIPFNYDYLIEFLNHAFIARYVRDPAHCIKFCKVKVVDEVIQKQFDYQLDSQFLDTTVHADHNSIGIVLNACNSSMPFKWPVLLSGQKVKQDVGDDSLALENSEENPSTTKAPKKRSLHIIACNASGAPYTTNCTNSMRINSQWNDGLTPRSSTNEFNFQWLKEYGIEILDEMEETKEGTACISTSIQLSADPPTCDFVHDMVVYIFEGVLKRDVNRIYSDWKGALREMRKRKSLFLNVQQWKKKLNTELYLPATSRSLVSIMTHASQPMKEAYAEALGVEVQDFDDSERVVALVEKMLREKMNVK